MRETSDAAKREAASRATLETLQAEATAAAWAVGVRRRWRAVAVASEEDELEPPLDSPHMA